MIVSDLLVVEVVVEVVGMLTCCVQFAYTYYT
jgi:hypothetical protein